MDTNLEIGGIGWIFFSFMIFFDKYENTSLFNYDYKIKRNFNLTLLGKIVYFPVMTVINLIKYIILVLAIMTAKGIIIMGGIVFWFISFYILLLKSLFFKNAYWDSLTVYHYKKKD